MKSPKLAVRMVLRAIVRAKKPMLRSPKGKDSELLPQAGSRSGGCSLMMTGTGAIEFERAVTLFGDLGICHGFGSKRTTDGTTAMTLPSAKEELEPLPAGRRKAAG